MLTNNPDEWRRSSRCSTGACLDARFRKSSFSGGNGCVEVRDVGRVEVRDSKLVYASPVLSFDPGRWAEFVAAVTAGEFASFRR